jgi:glycosyltransferase involved in cell wall biosynthesis
VTEVPADIEALWKGCEARIITVGTLKAQKNHALLISAFALLRRRRSAKLMILGKGPLLAALQQQAEQEGVAEDVLFPGFSTNPTAYMASAKLFVLSSDYEGFGNVLVEAMRLRLSLVSTDCKSGPAEILGSGRFGKLVPRGDPAALADAMDDALDSPTDGVLLAEQAERLSGQGSIDSYFEMMMGASATYQK